MPFDVNSRSATWRCTLAGNFARSIGHHAPDAPKPWIVWRGVGLTVATTRFAGVGTVGVVVVVDVAAGAGLLVDDDDEHAVATRTPSTSTVARRTPLPRACIFRS